jgi:hypothetical protein
MNWEKLLAQANERSRKYAKLIGEGVDSATATKAVYGAIMAAEIDQQLKDLDIAANKIIEQQPLKHHTPEYGC